MRQRKLTAWPTRFNCLRIRKLFPAQTKSPQKPIPPLVAQPPLALPAPPETSAKPSKTVRTSYQGSGTAGQPTARRRIDKMALERVWPEDVYVRQISELPGKLYTQVIKATGTRV